MNERARTFHNERLVVIRFETRDATRTMGSIERLIEQVEVHVGFFFLFGFRSRRGGRAAGVAAAVAAAAAAAAAARGHGRELGVTFSDQFRDVLTLDFLEEGGELGIVDLRRGCVRTKRVVVSSVARLSRRAFASRRVASRVVRDVPPARIAFTSASEGDSFPASCACASRSESPRQSSSPKP